MFFKQILRSSAKNRKSNGILFSSLVIAVVAFYTLLSLGEQDVMRFLKTIESDAVGQLMEMLPVIYIISLFFVFFLVYFSCKYQTDLRRREFGMYLMLGMKRRRLFLMLFCETLWNSLITLIIGIPFALLLTEATSLLTAKVVGLGIVSHQISFSANALLLTICGFVLIQLLAMAIICLPYGRIEPAQLLHASAPAQSNSKTKSGLYSVLGAVLLLFAYYLGIFQLKSLSPSVLLVLLVSGILGTFLLYKGIGGIMGIRILKKAPNNIGLATFTGRQIQENVICQYKSLAISSLLLLMALACVSYGISMGTQRSTDARSTDFTIVRSYDDSDTPAIEAFLQRNDVNDMAKAIYPMYFAMTDVEIDKEDFRSELRKLPGTENMLEYMHIDYVISESSYNNLLRATGKDELKLGNDKIALFSSTVTRNSEYADIFSTALANGPTIGINGKDYTFLPTPCYDNIVADRAITLSMALIVPDTLYFEIARDEAPYCWNIHIKDELVRETSLMQAISAFDELLAPMGFEYDSYLGGIGRNLFYTVSSSYITVYLGVLFLLIANTVLGLKYLIQQRQNRHRYISLFMLGANTENMCHSVTKQIKSFFLLALSVALLNSIAAILTLFSSFTRLPDNTSLSDFYTLLIIAGVMLIAFAIIELIYLAIVKRTACREIRALQITKREVTM